MLSELVALALTDWDSDGRHAVGSKGDTATLGSLYRSGKTISTGSYGRMPLFDSIERREARN